MKNQLIVALDATNELQILLETESIDNSMKIAKISRLNTIALKAVEFALFISCNINGEVETKQFVVRK